MNKELKQLLDALHAKPGMYIGEPSLEKLHTFVNGYLYCMNKRDNVVYEYVSGFQIFVEQYYQVFENKNFHHHWSRIISFFSSTEEQAFYKFYELLDEYLKVEDEYNSNEKLTAWMKLKAKKMMNM